jgi:hypothetical protein
MRGYRASERRETVQSVGHRTEDRTQCRCEDTEQSMECRVEEMTKNRVGRTVPRNPALNSANRFTFLSFSKRRKIIINE